MCADTPVPPASPTPRRRGVALIVVLGLMAVLVILAVSFVVVMRTERLTARAFDNDFRVRELCYVAMTRAMDHIQKNADTGGWMYPPWPYGVLPCTTPGTETPATWTPTGTYGPARDILVWRGREYMASNVHVMAEALTNNLKWIQIQEGTQYIGQITYMVVNTSGELDANGNGEVNPLLARAIPRTIGTNVNELQLHDTLLASVTSNGTNLFNGRTAVAGSTRSKPFGRAETIPDLWIAGRYQYSAGYPIKHARPSGFTTFSHYPTGFAYNGQATIPPVYIGGDAAQVIAQRSLIQSQFTQPGSGFTAVQAPMLTLNLLDYVDTDFIPGNAGGTAAANVYSICTEPVPMLNEIVVGSVILDSGATREVTLNLEVEVWYPFFGVTNFLSYSLRAAPQLSGGNFSAPAVDLALTPKAGPWICANPATPGFFQVFTGRWKSHAPVTNAILPTALDFPQFDILENNSQVADGLQPGAGGMAIRIPWSTYMANTPGVICYSGWRTFDPRINWSFPNLAASADSLQWSNELKQATAKTPGSTLNQANFAVATLGEDTRWQMHVRNRGDLPSPGHLGLLLYDSSQPWKTIPLLGANAKPVIDYFTVQRKARQGVVNINTTNEAVLATAFYRCATEIVPGATNGAIMDVATCRRLAQAIIAGRPPGGYTNLSDIARAGTQITTALPAGAPGAVWHDPDRESLIRNSDGLLGTRQNLFMIVCVAECRKKVINPETGAATSFRLAGQRAVAEVWRDPIKTPDPDVAGQWRNRMFVHFFRWLDD